MWGVLANLGKGLLTKLLPSAINWGVNKLMTSNFGKSVISPQLLQGASNVVQQMQSYQ